MADFGGLVNKAKAAANSEKGEQVSDSVIEKAGDAADSRTGGKHSDKINSGEDAVDRKIGRE